MVSRGLFFRLGSSPVCALSTTLGKNVLAPITWDGGCLPIVPNGIKLHPCPLEHNQGRCIPKPQSSSRRDPQGRGPLRLVFVVGVERAATLHRIEQDTVSLVMPKALDCRTKALPGRKQENPEKHSIAIDNSSLYRIPYLFPVAALPGSVLLMRASPFITRYDDTLFPETSRGWPLCSKDWASSSIYIPMKVSPQPTLHRDPRKPARKRQGSPA